MLALQSAQMAPTVCSEANPSQRKPDPKKLLPNQLTAKRYRKRLSFIPSASHAVPGEEARRFNKRPVADRQRTGRRRHEVVSYWGHAFVRSCHDVRAAAADISMKKTSGPTTDGSNTQAAPTHPCRLRPRRRHPTGRCVSLESREPLSFMAASIMIHLRRLSVNK